jgi:8-oxo-dGTP pyrophosphatase MutT (NUDIX family)
MTRLARLPSSIFSRAVQMLLRASPRPLRRGALRKSKSMRGKLSAPLMAIIERTSAKVLLVTASLDVLLFSSLDPGNPDRPRHWFAVGGGVEAGETLAETAVREVREETGLELSDVGSPVLTRHASFDFEGDLYEQDETYFVAWVERFAPSTDGWTELELRTTSGHRWWSIEELRTTTEVVYPERLAELLEMLTRPRHLWDGPTEASR